MRRIIQQIPLLLFACVVFCAERVEAGYLTVESDSALISSSLDLASSSMAPAKEDQSPRKSDFLLLLSQQQLMDSALGGSTTSSTANGSSSTSSSVSAMLPVEIVLLPELVTPLSVRDRPFCPQVMISEIFRPPCA